MRMAESGDGEHDHDVEEHDELDRVDQIPVGHELEVDSSSDTDNDSAIGDDTSSTSVTDYRHENGRRYHAYHDGAYYLPNDEIEAERLDLQHAVWRMTLNGNLYASPIEPDIKHCLDVGTGTGIWAIEFAEEHPNTQVTGTDLSPIQPSFVPPNCSFMVDNCEAEWVFDKKFDFIHARMLVLGMHDWPNFFRQCWENVLPGGWVEVQEVQFPLRCDDDSAGPNSALLSWSTFIQLAARKAGIESTSSLHFVKQLQDQGFINIKEETSQWAIGPWPKGKVQKAIGRYTLENILSGLQGISMALLTRHLGWSKEEVEVYLVDVRKECLNSSMHHYCYMTVHRAQKPYESTVTSDE